MSSYAVYYTDGTYMIYDLTESDYNALKWVLSSGGVAETSVGLLKTTDIRSIIVQKEEPKVEVKEQPAVPSLSMEEMQFLKRTLSGIYEEEELD